MKNYQHWKPVYLPILESLIACLNIALDHLKQKINGQNITQFMSIMFKPQQKIHVIKRKDAGFSDTTNIYRRIWK